MPTITLAYTSDTGFAKAYLKVSTHKTFKGIVGVLRRNGIDSFYASDPYRSVLHVPLVTLTIPNLRSAIQGLHDVHVLTHNSTLTNKINKQLKGGK